MRVQWQIFEAEGIRTEAQIFRSEKGENKHAVIFCPGFPGAGATLFEQRHAGALVEHGYDVIVIKHKGIKLDSPTAAMMVNNAARLAQARAKSENLTGGGPATIDEWLDEPIPVLRWAANNFERYDIIGNSFGALSALWSLTTGDAPMNRLGSVLLYAGAQGLWDETPQSIARVWKPEYISAPGIMAKVTLEDAYSIEARLKIVYKELPGRITQYLSEHVSLIYLIVEKDEILNVADSEKFTQAIGGRGRIVRDTIDHAWPEYGLLAHDTPNYKTEDIIALLRH